MKRILSVLTATTAFVMATPAMAVTFTSIAASWSDPIGGQDIGYFSGVGPGNQYPANSQRIRWGVPNYQNQSGYGFSATTTPFDLDVGVEKNLGQFTHFNFEQQLGTSASGATLNLLTNVAGYGNVNFKFFFTHNETDNQGDYPDCCNDLVSVNTNAASGSFMIGNTTYWLDVVGFLVNGQTVNQFSTAEDMVNNAGLLARLRSETPAIPEPSTWAMMILGLGLTGAALRRRQKMSVRFTF